MGKREIVFIIAGILLGIIFDRLMFYRVPQVHEALLSYFSSTIWGLRMDIITLALIGLAILVWLIALTMKKKLPKEYGEEIRLLRIIAKKLGVTDEELR